VCSDGYSLLNPAFRGHLINRFWVGHGFSRAARANNYKGFSP
jgi:hypothetical protein